MKRILSVWLPDLAIECFRFAVMRMSQPPLTVKVLETMPTALIEEGAKGTRLAAVNAPARTLGLHRGQRLTDARAIHPELLTWPDDPDTDAAMLARLTRWMVRYSPLVATDGTDGMLADITGCAHLFGGEAALAQDLKARAARIGFTAHTGLAATIGAAWGLARYAPSKPHVERSDAQGLDNSKKQPHVDPGLDPGDAQGLDHIKEQPHVDPGLDPGDAQGLDHSKNLTTLPVAALRLEPDTVLLLKRLGLKTVGSLTGISRIALERRFRSKQAASAVMLRLDQMTGKRDEPLNPLVPAPALHTRLVFADPILDRSSIEVGLAHLLKKIVAFLDKQDLGARALTLTACHADGGTSAETVRLARPTREVGHITRLFAERLDTIDPGYGIDALVLAAGHTEPLKPGQTSLEADKIASARDIALLIDKLGNRLGGTCVRRPAPRESHIPEHAQILRPAAETIEWPQNLPAMTPRPFRLLARPELIETIAEVPDGPPLRFIWRRVARRVVRARGPERIGPEWWDDTQNHDRLRDYYDVEDETGHRYWLFRAGLYHDQSQKGPPQWYLHGLFG